MVRAGDKPFLINPEWTFEEAVHEISAVHYPAGYVNVVVRIRLVEQWGSIVGRARAVQELDSLVGRSNSWTAAARGLSMAGKTLRRLRETFDGLPEAAQLSQSPPQSRFRDGQVVGRRFKIVEFITDGGMGSVYRAEDLNTNQRVVLKRCFAEFSDLDRRRFAREVRAMRAIQHPNVMPVLHANVTAQVPYFVMPEARCRLDERFASLRANAEDALAAFRQICAGVEAIHRAGQVHRDIKPHNILLVEDEWVVSDLGLVVFLSRDSTILTKSSELMGTEGFIAPELRTQNDRPPDTRSDIYSLAKVLYLMLVDADAAYVNEVLLGDRAIARVLGRATQPNPANRYSSVAEMQEALGPTR